MSLPASKRSSHATPQAGAEAAHAGGRLDPLGIVCILIGEEYSVQSVLNCFEGAAGPERDYGTAASLCFNGDHSEVFACREDQGPCRPV